MLVEKKVFSWRLKVLVWVFTHKMAPKTSWHRYGNKLRYCHPICKWSWTDKPTQTDRQTDTLITILRVRNRGRSSLIVETCSSSRDALSVRFADRSSSSKDRTKLYGCQRNMLSVGKQLAMKSATNTIIIRHVRASYRVKAQILRVAFPLHRRLLSQPQQRVYWYIQL